jgi:hypothetical protein
MENRDKPFILLEHRMGVEPMNTGFAGEKNGLFSVTYGKQRSL